MQQAAPAAKAEAEASETSAPTKSQKTENEK